MPFLGLHSGLAPCKYCIHIIKQILNDNDFNKCNQRWSPMWAYTDTDMDRIIAIPGQSPPGDQAIISTVNVKSQLNSTFL